MFDDGVGPIARPMPLLAPVTAATRDCILIPRVETMLMCCVLTWSVPARELR